LAAAKYSSIASNMANRHLFFYAPFGSSSCSDRQSSIFKAQDSNGLHFEKLSFNSSFLKIMLIRRFINCRPLNLKFRNKISEDWSIWLTWVSNQP